ncbi:hypothetical protein P154DRAFT_476554 [Amniculicola lignicola CBS 123094]|uniref:Pre-mRNA-splicing factor SYF2 n=1 Tax=Amniculicola lignicola CBS 123094 TaxID=1392246 RepID=A0A6A5VYK7_9PLEO|nr:hypothetical protein P154DRAFT_476554 [Amniculicola lignicola CBS 123094]
MADDSPTTPETAVIPAQEEEVPKATSENAGETSVPAGTDGSPRVTTSPTTTNAVAPANSAHAARLARFAALKAQSQAAKKDNRTEVLNEAKRSKTDFATEYKKAERRGDDAALKLLKESDPDFERKRAMDYTVEESENWDKRMSKKAKHKDGNAFSDYTAEASKVYKNQVKRLEKERKAGDEGGRREYMEGYAREKAELMQRQVERGVLELMEENGEVFTYDPKTGKVDTPAEEGYNFDHQPSKEAIDRLVNDLKAGERARLKKRADRGAKEDDGNVTYINHKNKQFNEKLARFYNRYTTEIRESFERGTAI